MKKLFILGAALAVFPSAGLADSTMKMVTYFPVPYVAYSKINAQKQMDVGLTSACEMNLGCAESGALGTPPLQATAVNLNRGKLDLNTAAAVKSTNVTLGSGSGEANIDFATNLRIGTLNNGYSLESNDMTVDELKLFASHMKSGGEKFPSCAATGASGAPQVSWQKVKLKKAEEVYLVCGNPGDVSKCEPTHNGQETYTETCPSGQTGSIKYTWNYDSCKYLTLNTCRSTMKTCLTKALYCGTLDVSRGAANEGICYPPGSPNSSGISYECNDIRLRNAGFFVGYYLDVSAQEAFRSNGYEMNLPSGCSLGSECNSCTPGKKYFISNSLKGQSCYDSTYLYGPGSCRTLYVFQYAMCGEMSDCSAGTEVTCSSWKDAGGSSNPLPFQPSNPDLTI